MMQCFYKTYVEVHGEEEKLKTIDDILLEIITFKII